MKRRITISLIAITCFGVLSPITASADNPLDKLIPRGTLFKKLKQEIIDEFGGDKAKTPTPRRAPTPAAARPNDRRRQVPTNARPPQDRQSAQQQSAQRQQQTRRQPNMATRPLPPMNNRAQVANRTSRPAQRPIQPAGIGASRGFGVIVQMAKNNDMVVTRLHPQGNAIKAGLKPGDIVKTVGSVKLSSIEEYDQITKGLKPGDQMEFEVVRRGRPEKLLVPFGTAPDEMQVSSVGSLPAVNAPTEPFVDSTIALDGVPSVLDNSMQPVARVSRLPQAAPSVVAVSGEAEKRLYRTIESQRAKMERMEQELEMLRKTTTPAIQPTENNWALPELGSPN